MSSSTAVSKHVASNTATAVVPFEEMERMGAAIAKSGLFGVKTVDQAVALMVIAQAEGRHPGSVANDYHIIQGRPSLKSDTMLSRYLAAGGTVKWTSYTSKKVAAIFTHPQSGAIEVEWTIDMAQAAGLAGKDNWKAYPRAMLRARVISEGVRTSYPGVSRGMYTPEEIADMPLLAEGEPINVTPGASSEGELIPAGTATDRPRGKAATQAPRRKAQTGDQTGGRCNASQIKIVRAKLDHAGIPDKEFLERFDIDSIEDLLFDQLNEALAWIANPEQGREPGADDEG